MNRTLGLALTAMVALLAAVSAPSALAFPFFSSAESGSCTRCHTSPPQLNVYGVRYDLAGYRAPGEQGLRSTPPVSIVEEFGAAFARTDSTRTGGAHRERSGGEFRQYMLDAHSAGALTRHVSYGLEANLQPVLGTFRAPESFVQFDPAADGTLAVRAGRFETGLPFLSEDRRGTLAPYLAPVATATDGIELRGSRASWTAAADLVNSDRTPAGAGTTARLVGRLEDQCVWLMRTFDEQMLGARVAFDRQDSNISYHAWLQRLQVTLAGSVGTHGFRILPAYMLDRFDDRPAAGIHERHQYVLLETLALLDPRGDSTVSARLEHEHVTPTVLTRGEDHDLEVVRWARRVSPNARLALELTHAGDNLGTPRQAGLDASVALAY